MSIYTRTGDKGTTALFGGKRVLKCNELVDVYGSLDELNSWIGLIASQLQTVDVQEFFSCLQSDLFTIGSVFAGANLDISFINARIKEMEARIDSMEEALPKLKNFILPGGHPTVSVCHLCRTVCRRAERLTVALVQSGEPVEALALQYLNRLSDYFFLLARFLSKELNVEEVIWKSR